MKVGFVTLLPYDDHATRGRGRPVTHVEGWHKTGNAVLLIGDDPGYAASATGTSSS